MNNVSVPNYFARAVIKHIDKCGIDRDELLRRHQVASYLLETEGARLPVEQFVRLQLDVMQRMDDELLGYLEAPIPVGSFALASRCLIQSRSLGAALHRYCQFYTLLNRGLAITMERGRQQTRVRVSAVGGVILDPYVFESSLYYIHRLLNWLGNSFVPLQRVSLAYPKPAHAGDYRQLFMASPVQFAQPTNELLISTALLKQPVLQTPQSLARFLPNALQAFLMQEANGVLWSNKVALLLGKSVGSGMELPEVALALNLHPQTLRRRLQAEGTCFQDIKNAQRRDMAIHLLSRTENSVEEIATAVGFSEPSTFIRAFRSWTGVTPLSYRKID